MHRSDATDDSRPQGDEARQKVRALVAMAFDGFRPRRRVGTRRPMLDPLGTASRRTLRGRGRCRPDKGYPRERGDTARQAQPRDAGRLGSCEARGATTLGCQRSKPCRRSISAGQRRENGLVARRHGRVPISDLIPVARFTQSLRLPLSQATVNEQRARMPKHPGPPERQGRQPVMPSPSPVPLPHPRGAARPCAAGSLRAKRS
jgi:hypothetical protein